MRATTPPRGCPASSAYTDNGQRTTYRDDTGRVTEYRLRLDRRAWQAAAAQRDSITVTGIAPCAPLFGITPPGRTGDTTSAARTGEAEP